jgi:Fur family ferric uptake transcriptional regulator
LRLLLNTIANISQLVYDFSAEMKDVLTQAGYKLTKPRLAILTFLKKQTNLLSAREISKKIKNIDQASVYRTLNLFEELNIVNSELIDKEKLYCLSDHPHHHIICRVCKYSEEFPCTQKEDYKKFSNFSNIHHHLTLTGVCKKCK